MLSERLNRSKPAKKAVIIGGINNKIGMKLQIMVITVKIIIIMIRLKSLPKAANVEVVRAFNEKGVSGKVKPYRGKAFVRKNSMKVSAISKITTMEIRVLIKKDMTTASQLKI